MSTTAAKPLLIELFTEELPPKALKNSAKRICVRYRGQPSRRRPAGERGATTVSFATPRRLGARVDAVLTEAPAKAIKEN